MSNHESLQNLRKILYALIITIVVLTLFGSKFSKGSS